MKNIIILFISIILIIFISAVVCIIPPFFESQFDIFNLTDNTFEFINSSRSIIFTIIGFLIGFLGFSYRFVLEKIQINYFNYILNNWVILSLSFLSSYLVLSTYYLTFYNSVNLNFLYFLYFLFPISILSSLSIFKSMIDILNFKLILNKKIKTIGSIFTNNTNQKNKELEELEELKCICFYYIKIRDIRAEEIFQQILYYYCEQISTNKSGGALNSISDNLIKYTKEFFEKSMDIALSEKNISFINSQINSILKIYKIFNNNESDKNFNDYLIRTNIVDHFIINNIFNNKIVIGHNSSLIFDKLIRCGNEELIINSINILKEMMISELDKYIINNNNEKQYNKSYQFIIEFLDILSYVIKNCENKELYINIVNFICDNLPSDIYNHFENEPKEKFNIYNINIIDYLYNKLCDIHIDIIKNNLYNFSDFRIPFYLNLEHFYLKTVKNKYINLIDNAKKNKKITKKYSMFLKSLIRC